MKLVSRGIGLKYDTFEFKSEIGSCTTDTYYREITQKYQDTYRWHRGISRIGLMTSNGPPFLNESSQQLEVEW
jgi:hypothetical protein